MCAMILLAAGMLLAAGIIFALAMKNMSDTIAGSGRILNETIAEESSANMAEQSQKRLKDLAAEKAGIADEIFSDFEQRVGIVASMAGQIYEHPEQYSERAAALPVAEKDGQLTVQVLYSASADPSDPEIMEELALIGNIQDALVAINESKESIASIYMATESGFMVQADFISGKKFDSNGNLMPLEARERPWYQGAAATGRPFFTPVTRDAHTPRLGIMCGVPVYRGTELMGVAGAGMYLEEMEDLVRSVDLGGRGNACIINENGQVLFSTFPEGTLAVYENAEDLRRSGDEALARLITRSIEGGSGVALLSVDGISGYAAYAPMSTVGWSMIVFLEQEAVDAPTRQLLGNVDRMISQANQDTAAHIRHAVALLLGLLGVAVVISIAVSLFISRRIVNPIEKLTEEVRGMEGNQLDFHWDLDTGDETQVLAHSFRSLTMRMKDYIHDIELVTKENERINTELSLASSIQANMLPSTFPPFPDRKDVDVYASMDAAREVGGDFYDFFLIDEDHLCLVMADVSGKGIPAALFMMASKIILGNYAMLGQTPGQILETANEAVCATNKDDMFVTAWLGILDLKTGLLTAANAGHEYPVLRQPGGEYEILKDRHGLVIGGMPGLHYREYTVQLQPGAKLFLYTDGVPEATDSENALFGMERMLDALNADSGANAEGVLNRVRQALDEFVAGAEQFDDITMMCVEYMGQKE